MDVAEIKRALHQHAKLRMPRFAEGSGRRSNIEDLESYLGEVAIARGELEEARLWADHIRYELEGDWDRIEGWEMHIQGKASKATGPQIVAAKRQCKPGVYDALREAKWLVARLGDQIKRLEKDEENASRRYTLIVGG